MQYFTKYLTTGILGDFSSATPSKEEIVSTLGKPLLETRQMGYDKAGNGIENGLEILSYADNYLHFRYNNGNHYQTVIYFKSNKSTNIFPKVTHIASWYYKVRKFDSYEMQAWLKKIGLAFNKLPDEHEPERYNALTFSLDNISLSDIEIHFDSIENMKQLKHNPMYGIWVTHNKAFR